MLATLASEDAADRFEAALALAGVGNSDPRVLAVLQDSLSSDEWYVRWKACLSLGSLGHAAAPAVPALISCMEREKDIGREVAIALAKVGPDDPGVVRVLLAHLERHAGDRVAVLRALAAAGPRAIRAAPVAARELMRDDPASHRSALKTLQATGAPPEVLDQLLLSRNAQARDWASAGILRSMTSALLTESTEAVVSALESGTSLRQVAACRVLRWRGTEAREAVPSLIPLLVHEQSEVRKAAAEAMAAVGGEPLTRTVFFCEKDEEHPEPVRFVAPLGAGAELLAILTDARIGVATLDALSKLDTTGATEGVLNARIRSANVQARVCSALLLGYLRVDRDIAVRLLRRALDDQSEEVRTIASASLKRLGAKSD